MSKGGTTGLNSSGREFEPVDHSTPGRLKGYRKTFKNSPHGCSSQVLGLERIELAATLFNVIKRNCTDGSPRNTVGVLSPILRCAFAPPWSI